MTVDCQWMNRNLEAFFCDALTDEESRSARTHLESCIACSREVQAIKAIDPLVRNYFRRELEYARRRPATRVRVGRLLGLSGSVAAVAALAVLMMVRSGSQPPLPTPSAFNINASPVPPLETAPSTKDDPSQQGRAKPSAGRTVATTRNLALQNFYARGAGSDFLVLDPAGYSHTLDEYRGHVVVIGVWNPDQAQSVAGLEQLYKTFGANPKLRFLGIANERWPKPPNTTFPVLYNQGSKLFGAEPGEFVMLDPQGAVHMRGSLVKDFDRLRRALQAN